MKREKRWYFAEVYAWDDERGDFFQVGRCYPRTLKEAKAAFNEYLALNCYRVFLWQENSEGQWAMIAAYQDTDEGGYTTIATEEARRGFKDGSHVEYSDTYEGKEFLK